MMQNYNKVLEAQRIEAESTGLAVERYGIYLDSVEAAQNRFTASWEKLASNTIDSDLIKFFLNTGSALLDLTDTVGLFNIAVVALGAFLATKFVVIIPGITAAIDAMAVSMGVAAGAATTLSLALTGGLIAIGVLGAIAAFNHLNKSIVDTYQNFNKLKSISDENQNELKSLAEEYEDLANKQDRTVEETTRLLDIQTILNTKYGASTAGIDAYTDAIDGNTAAIRKNIEWMKNQADQQAKMFLDKNKYAYDDAKNFLGSSYTDNPNMSIAGLKPDEAIKYLDEQIAKGKDVFGLLRQQRDSILEQIDAAQKLVIEYEHYENAIDAANEKQQTGNLGDNYRSHYDSVKKLVEVYKGLAETIKGVHDEASMLYDLSGKQAEGLFNYEDAIKLLETNKEYINLLEIENGKISLNTEKLREYNIEKAKGALETAKKNGASEKELQILQNYLDQTERAIPLTRDYVDNFQNLINQTGNALGGENMPEEFKRLGTYLTEQNQFFKEGKISAVEYFNSINESASNLNMKEVFGSNAEAADTFFGGLVLNATEAIPQIITAFNAGQMTIVEFTDSLGAIGGTFETLVGMVGAFGETLGFTAEESAAYQSELGGYVDSMMNSIGQLNEMSELNAAISTTMFEINRNNLQAGTEDYINYMNTVAQAYFKTNQSYTDTLGNIYTSSDSLASHLSQNTGNFMSFAGNSANQMELLIEGIVHNVGAALVQLGGMINQFDFKLSITPQPGDMVPFPMEIFGQEMSFISLPGIDLNVGTEGIGDFVSSVGSGLGDFDIDLGPGIYEPIDNQVNPGVIDDAVGGYEDLRDSIEAVGDAAGKAADEQKKAIDDLIKNIERAKKAEIDALKDELKAYKDIIDEKKKALDWEEKQKDFEEEVADKTKEIADIEAEIAELSLDDSMEAQARILELQEELEKRKQELEEAQREQSIEEQKKALDDEYKLFEDDIERKIKAIEDFLDQLGAIEAKTIEELLAKLEELGVTVNVETGTIETHHQGAKSGFVGGQSLSSDSERFAKLLQGELVLQKSDMDNFMQRTLPNLMSIPQFSSNIGGGGISIENLIRIDGDATRDILPDLEKIADNVINKLNGAMGNKGFIRGVKSFC